MISQIEKIPITECSHPFAAAATKCDFSHKGYVEEEYFIHGTANVYGWVNERKAAVFRDNPYVNRIIIRKPSDIASFSGNVVVEILNSTSFIDFDRCWALNYRFMMRNGDIYIGITSKPNVIPAMLKLDKDRYRKLNWSNPQKVPDYKLKDCELGNMEGASSPETEDGLFWDMLTDLAKLLREKNNKLIGEYGDYYQYLAGWSQSGGYMIRFINDFAYDSKLERPYFDGYYSAGSAGSCMPDLNQGYGQTAMRNLRKLKKIEQPFIEMHTESENALWGNTESRGVTTFDKDMQYCIHDVPGTTHDAKSTMIEYYYGDMDVFLAGIVPVYPGKETTPNSVPYEAAFQAALSSLYGWVREGKKPPVTEPIKVDCDLKNITDDTGNAIGGYRLPFVEVPICIYHTQSTPMKPDYAFACTLFGYEENYDKERAQRLYGDARGYLDEFESSLSDCIARELVLPEDKELCMNYARRKAIEVFG